MIARRLQTTRGRIVSFVVFFLACLIAGGVLGTIDGSREAQGKMALIDAPQAVWVVLVIAVLGSIGSFIYGYVWMKSIDEAAQEAHKWSWYWGGSVGMGVGVALMLTAFLPSTAAIQVPAILNGRTDPAAYMVMGAGGMILLMLVGYGVGWAWWWWSRR